MAASPEPGGGAVAASRNSRIRPRQTFHHARVVWQGTSSDPRAHRVELSGETLGGSCAPELGGDGERADPEELFVAALSACHMLWFLSLARGRHIRVTAYEDEPEGELDGTRFARVALRPQVAYENPPEAAVVDELHDQAHELCFIANSVNCPVEIEPR